jgi:hypothetical protein
MFTLMHKILTFILFSFFSTSAEDEAAAARITAKNGLESYTYNLRNSVNDEKLAGKFEPADKTKLEGAINETIKWLDASQEASKEEYEEKQKELEGISKYVPFPLSSIGLLAHWSPFLAPLCKNSTVLQVVHLAALAAGLVASLLGLLVASQAQARMVPAWRRSTNFL